MGSWGPIGGGGELIASSCGTAVTQNEKTQEMDHKESRPWTAPLRRPQGHHGVSGQTICVQILPFWLCDLGQVP